MMMTIVLGSGVSPHSLSLDFYDLLGMVKSEYTSCFLCRPGAAGGGMVRIFPNLKLELRLSEALVLLIILDLRGLGRGLSPVSIFWVLLCGHIPLMTKGLFIDLSESHVMTKGQVLPRATHCINIQVQSCVLGLPTSLWPFGPRMMPSQVQLQALVDGAGNTDGHQEAEPQPCTDA